MNDNKNTQHKPRGFEKLNAYLDRTNEDIFSKNAIGMLIEGLEDIEIRGWTAVIAANKKPLQEKMGKAVALDIFNQSMDVIRIANVLRGLMIIVKAQDEMFSDPVKINTLHMFVSEKIVELMDHEEGMCKLMRSIIHVMDESESDKS